jgi:signal transduction histidine kinase
MKGKSLKLSIQGLILVLVLLALEIIFVGCHAWLLEQAEEEARKQEVTKEIIARASVLLKAFVDGGEGMAVYAENKEDADLKKFTDAQKVISENFNWLREQLSDDPEQLKLLGRIEARWAKGEALLLEVKKVVDTEPLMIAAKYALKRRGLLEEHMSIMVAELNEFHAREWEKTESTPVMKRQRDEMKILLFAGVVFNIIMAVVFGRYFVVSVTSRLAIIIDNADRLRERRMLRAPLIGDDEIALLDKAFHEMWHSLRGEETLVMASQEQLKAIVDQMPIGLMITAVPDDQEIIEYANPTLEKLLAFKSGALENRPLFEHFAQVGVNNKPRPLYDTNTVEGVVRMFAYKNDRSALPVEFSVTDVSISNILRRLATVIDISEKVEVEKMKAAFVSMISHELRTPLTSVSGFLQLLPMGAYGELSPRAGEAAAVAEVDVDRLITLINDLLDLEKLEAGKLEMARAQFDLEETVDGAIDAVYAVSEKTEAQVLLQGCKHDLLGDADRVKQAFVKLLTGILQLSSRGEIIKIFSQAGDGGSIRVLMHTSNLKLAQDRLQTIFEPFQQVDSPAGVVSLGLGLPLARAIIVAHGGLCGAANSAEGETYFWLQFPL